MGKREKSCRRLREHLHVPPSAPWSRASQKEPAGAELCSSAGAGVQCHRDEGKWTFRNLGIMGESSSGPAAEMRSKKSYKLKTSFQLFFMDSDLLPRSFCARPGLPEHPILREDSAPTLLGSSRLLTDPSVLYLSCFLLFSLNYLYNPPLLLPPSPKPEANDLAQVGESCSRTQNLTRPSRATASINQLGWNIKYPNLHGILIHPSGFSIYP